MSGLPVAWEVVHARRIVVDPEAPDEAAIAEAAAALLAGDLVALPTETVYGLGAVATDAAAIRRVFEAKGRPTSDPLIVHVHPTWDLAPVLADRPSPVARRLIDAFWPGPLTIVAHRAAAIPDEVTAGGDLVAVRAPAHPVALALLAATGTGVAAPSANRFSYVSPTSADHVLADLGDACAIVLDAGRTTFGIESTVVVERDGRLEVLRHGAVTAEELAAAVGDLVAVVDPADDVDHGASVSPGRSARHYAPTTPTIAIARAALAEPLVVRSKLRITHLGLGDRPAGLPSSARHERLGDADDLPGAAWALYDALRRLDAEGTTDLLLIERTGAPGLGRAIDDRIGRAASGRRADTPAELAEQV